ncbi:hypothetical protein A2774_00400 [Candidatus Roizmanbacteria bacterium RIFCSPHIGHO2_01_FULL_39_12c]|uniref:Cytidyltransferase-like domain-containing protein n=1 Tax=Candidatus Roizmanbacteria bacterium RIFCSPHIGHO2_01_FULL_39_12c TaxID=1802031 RepID=A0A1F7GDN0_9BACT|nr:MAG: hypothetical protein A2774_00400 [Candidatus Roizmanbacteria bacterium RIFCSPHIGHO2_01_FULL_39_12c]
MKKIVSFRELKTTAGLIGNKKKVLLGGCFDLLHFGHLTLLKNAKREGNFMIIALESDEFIKMRKKRNPIHSQEQRAEILASINTVDLVVKLPFLKSDEEYFQLVRLIKPSVIAITQGDKQTENKNRQAGLVGARLAIVTNLIKGFSTKKIIKALG